MPTRRNILELILAAAAACAAVPARAAEPSAKAFVTAIYATYVGKDTAGMRLDLPATRRVFTPGLLKLIDADAKAAAKRNEPGKLDGDPFVDAQDWEIASFTVDIQDIAPGKAKAKVAFKNQDKDVTVSLDLVKLKSGWRIDEIVGPSGPLRELLTKK